MGAEAVSAEPKYRNALAPPDDATVSLAVERYASLLKQTYGSQLKGVFLFGSRARGDHSASSDADVALVLDDQYWDRRRDLGLLAGLEWRLISETGADIQGWPIRASEWRNPEAHANPSLVRAILKDSRPIHFSP